MSADDESNELKNKIVVGLTEYITIKGASESREIIARVDSGATKSSIDLSLASELDLGPIIDSKLIRSAHGTKLRPVIEVTTIIRGRTLKAKFTVSDRAHMRYQVLIGQNILKNSFLIDPVRRVDNPQLIKKQ